MDSDKFSHLTKRELQDILRAAGLKVSGTKAELLDRVMSNTDNSPAVPIVHTAAETDCDSNNNDEHRRTEDLSHKRKILDEITNTNHKKKKGDTKADIIKKLKEMGANKLYDATKPELEEKLKLWQKENLGRKLVQPVMPPPETHLQFPSERHFHPLTNLRKSEVSALTLKSLSVWFEERLATTSKDRGRELFLNKFLKHVRVYKNENQLFVKGTCAAATKRSVDYCVEILFSLEDWFHICQATCGDNCPAGKGFSVACKHVSALAHCIEHFARTGEVIENVSCTSSLQTWHHPSTASTEGGRGLLPATINDIIKSPLPQIDNCCARATSDFINILINCKAQSSSLYPRAVNGEALMNDFGDLSGSPLALSVMDSVNYVNGITADKIEKKTRQQSNCKLWKIIRRSRLTASMAWDAIRTVRTGNFAEGPAKRQIVSRPLKVPAVMWGKIHENEAINTYQKVVGTTVNACGIFIDKGCHFVAASPDGWTTDNVLIEVKCLYAGRNGPPENAPCLAKKDINGYKVYYLKKNHKYYTQCQLQMHVTNVHRLDFIIWTKKGIYIEPIKYNADFCEKALCDLSQYFQKVFAPMFVKIMWGRETSG